ncbi:MULTISPECIES: hypothetical protein [Cellulophaga]|uniref:Uncharacterized protein n=1 Tax=Cellulophaga algicola (strain DSM 14237 / IC166 / ACAM 630) TaxID=688270 RepID=E6XC61_CELAD|nr:MULTISPECIES: hypothetical protein [Cellulophaga]ADV51114.1 hypothetical protein Celal_3868 [Cellulophaga algicola DSM 14237]
MDSVVKDVRSQKESGSSFMLLLLSHMVSSLSSFPISSGKPSNWFSSISNVSKCFSEPIQFGSSEIEFFDKVETKSLLSETPLVLVD